MPTTGTPWRTSVSHSMPLKPNAPSPSSSTTWLPGRASAAPERLPRARAQAAERPGVEPAARRVGVDDAPRVGHEVAAVADDDRVAVEHLRQLGVQPHRVQRRRGRRRARPPRPRERRSRCSRSVRDPAPRSPTGRGGCRRAARRGSPAAPRTARRPARADATRSGSARSTTTISVSSPNAPPKPSRKSIGTPTTSATSAPFSPAERAREKASSWSAGTQPRARPLRNTGMPQRLDELEQRVLAVPPPQVAARHDDRPLGLRQQRERAPEGVGVRLAAAGRRSAARPARPPPAPRRTRGRAGSRRTRDRPARAARRASASSMSAGISPGDSAVAANRASGRTNGRWSISCSDPCPQRHAGARPPSTTIGEWLCSAAPIALSPFVTPGPAVSAATPGRARDLRPALGRERRRRLVARVDERDALRAAAVVDREEVAAGEREDGVDALRAQPARREPAAVQGGAAPPSPSAVSPLVRRVAALRRRRRGSTARGASRGRSTSACTWTRSRLPCSSTVPRGSTPGGSSSSRRVASVMRTSSPVSRVTRSTRAAVFTTSPMTVNSRRPAAADRARDDRPRVHADADRELARRSARARPCAISRAAATPHSACPGSRLGRAEHGEQPVADELVDVPAVLLEHGDDAGRTARSAARRPRAARSAPRSR